MTLYYVVHHFAYTLGFDQQYKDARHIYRMRWRECRDSSVLDQECGVEIGDIEEV